MLTTVYWYAVLINCNIIMINILANKSNINYKYLLTGSIAGNIT